MYVHTDVTPGHLGLDSQRNLGIQLPVISQDWVTSVYFVGLAPHDLICLKDSI